MERIRQRRTSKTSQTESTTRQTQAVDRVDRAIAPNSISRQWSDKLPLHLAPCSCSLYSHGGGDEQVGRDAALCMHRSAFAHISCCARPQSAKHCCFARLGGFIRGGVDVSLVVCKYVCVFVCKYLCVSVHVSAMFLYLFLFLFLFLSLFLFVSLSPSVSLPTILPTTPPTTPPPPPCDHPVANADNNSRTASLASLN